MLAKTDYLISIITVVKDDFQGFLDTSTSILKQLDPSIEWLIVDGSSNHEIADWCSERRSMKNISYIWQHPGGIYRAMNLGVTSSTGNWLWFINAGDILMGVTSLSRIKRLLEEEHSWKLLAAPVVYLTPKGSYYDVVTPSILMINDYLVAGFHHQGVITSREVFENIGGFDENLKFAADGKFLDSAIANFEYSLSNVIATGFSMGGRSMKNFAQTVYEASRYRPYSRILYNPLLFLKNDIRKILISLEDLSFISWYLQRRHRKQILCIEKLDSGFVPLGS